MKSIGVIFLFIIFSKEGICQHFLFNTQYSHHTFYDSGVYSLKMPNKARANLVNLGVSYKLQYFELGLSASLGTIKNFYFEGINYFKSNLIGTHVYLSYHIFKEENNFLVDPNFNIGYGLKMVSFGTQLSKYYQANYGIGLNFHLSEGIKIGLSESFNLSIKNLFFNNLQTTVGLQWAFSKGNKGFKEEYQTNLNQKIKDDSILYVKQLKDIEFKGLYNQRKLKDSLERQISLYKKKIDKLSNDKNILLESSVTLKSQIDLIRMNSWAKYETYKLTKDTLIKVEQLALGNYASFTTAFLPELNDRKELVAIKGHLFICINPYNYYKICIEANKNEPLIPPDFLKYYPMAELWRIEKD